MLKKGANYLNYSNIVLTQQVKTPARNINLRKIFTSFFATLSIFLLISTMLVPATNAWADDKTEDKLNKALSDFYDGEQDNEGFMQATEKAELEWRSGNGSEESKAKFSYLFYRMLGLNYMNDVEMSVGNTKNICDLSHKDKGTPLYHNCDIPNLTTEFIQDLISLIDDDGMATKGATKQSSKVFLPEIGLPSTIVEEGVPVSANNRTKKYTGLELYGYNFQFSTYNGEWDHIKVMTRARAMSNFGLMDKINLTVVAGANGIVSGFKYGMKNFGESFKKGDIFGMITAGFRALEAAASDAIRTIIDTSDLNVHDTYGWYRVNYPKTLYNARQLTQVELSVIANKAVLEYLDSQTPEEAQLPAEFEAVRNAPGEYLDKIAGCIVETWNVKTPNNIDEEPVVKSATQMDCDLKAKAKEYKVEDEENPENDIEIKARGKWADDLYRKAETRQQYKDRFPQWFEMAKKYNINVTLSDSGTAKTAVNNYRLEWPAAFVVAEEAYLEGKQNTLFNEWKKLLTNSVNLMRNWFIKDKPTRNFNAPFMRFVCVDSNGKDLKDSNGDFVWLYDENGVANASCGKVRPPIQGAMFGDGYINSTAPIDTRRAEYSFDIVDILAKHPLFAGNKFMIEKMAEFNLAVSSFMTRISNTFLNLSMTPILDFFGINDLIVSLIDSFRESVFMALALLVIGVSAVMILISTMKSRSFKKGFIDIGTMVLTFMVAIFLLQFPKEIVNGMDAAPSYVQSVIMASIFSAGTTTTETLCEATNNNGNAVTGFDGKSIGYAPSEASRTLMCENWRVFALTPWVQGQWGTNLSNLENSEMLNTNGDLVGDAAVNMGNNQIMNNWAIYQLEISSSGTSTTEDPSNPTGVLDPNFYRIVDLQFGPNNGEASDSRYADAWAGGTAHRVGVTFLGAIMSIAGAVTVILYSISLIQVSVVSSLMLIGLPFVLLIGLNPTFGRGKMWKYLQTLLSLLIQRVVLVTLLAIMFTLLIAVSDSSSNFTMVAVVTIALCIVFIMYRKELMKMLNFGLSNVASKFTDNPKQAIQSALPKSIQNRVKDTSARVKGFTGGYIAGAVSAGTVNPLELHKKGVSAGSQSANAARQTNYNKDRRKHGFGAIKMMSNTYDSVASQTKETKKREINPNFDNLDQHFETGGTGAVLDIDSATPKQLRRISKLNKNLNSSDDHKERAEKTGILSATPIGTFATKRHLKKSNKKKDKALKQIKKHQNKYSRESLKTAKKQNRKKNVSNIKQPVQTRKRKLRQKEMIAKQLGTIDYEKTPEQYQQESFERHKREQQEYEEYIKRHPEQFDQAPPDDDVPPYDPYDPYDDVPPYDSYDPYEDDYVDDDSEEDNSQEDK